MREIKFRAWDKERKIMIGTDYPKNWGREKDEYYFDVFCLQLTLIEQINKDKRFEVMQFTGLKDKNGVEIYEGDMFGRMGGDVERPGEYEIHAIVYFDEDLGAFCIDDNRGGWEYLFDYLNEQRNEREIIGNIWENPELLVQPTK